MAKKYKEDDKERLKKAAKRAKGNIRNDESDKLLQQLGLGLAGTVALSVVLFQVAKRATVTPREAADWAATTTAAWAEVHGGTAATVLAALAALYVAGGWGYRTLRARQRAADAEAAASQAAADKSARRERRVEFQKQRAEERSRRALAQQRAIAEEESLLAQLKANQNLEAAAEKERSARLWSQAALWSAAEQAALDKAIEAIEASDAPTHEKWSQIAARVNGRTDEECLVRVRYCRHRAMLEAEASAQYDEPEDDDDFFGDDGGGDDDGGGLAAAHGYRGYHPSDNEDADGDYGDDEDQDPNPDHQGSDAEQDDAAVDERVPIDLQPARKGTEIKFEKVTLWKIGTVRPAKLRVQCACIKCDTRFDAELCGDSLALSSVQQYCLKCSALQQCALRPCLLHGNSSTLGFVDTRRCRIVDVLPSDLHAACADCNTEYPMNRVRRGVRVEHACFSCHHKLAFEAKQFGMDEHSVESAGDKGGGGAKPKRAAAAGPRIVEGQELPNLGACDHFKKSLRWLRFPCCGKAYPCPICHELGGCDSLGTLANRMICGKCSVEQNFANRPCDACNFHMGKGRGGASHWSGGGGSRNFSQLSRKDHRKNKGVSRSGTAKTVSQKANRVGAAGKKAKLAPGGKGS